MSEQLATHPKDVPANVIPMAGQKVTKPLRICLLGYRSAPHGGGQGIYIRYLSKALVEAGHQVDVISGQPYPEVDDRVRLIKLPGLNLYENGLFSLRPRHMSSLANWIEWFSKLLGGFAEPQTFGRRAVKYLSEHGRDYDIIHDNQCLSFGMLKLQQLGFPLVTTVHHPITQDLDLALNAARNIRERILIHRWHSFVYMQKYVIQRLNHLVTVSECSKRDISRDFEISDEHIDLVYNGIDTRVFAPVPKVVRLSNRIMATASADQPLKGLRFLIKAFALLLPDYPNLELLVIGKPKEDGDTARLIKRLRISNNITFVSGISTERLVEYYAEATMVVTPSLYEGFGLPAGEAMACGVPVISSTGGALPEVVGDAGILVQAGTVEPLAEAIKDLLDDAEKRDRIGLQGRKRIEDKFCWQKAALEMTDFYYRVLEQESGNS